MKYLNGKKVPQIFVTSGATKFGDPDNFPWTMGWIPHYRSEAMIYGKQIIANNPNARVAILYQNDDFGRDYLAGLKQGLGEKAQQMLVAQVPYELTEPTVSSSIITLKASGADTLVVAAISKFATQAIATAAGLSWKPTMYISNTAATVESTLRPAGLANAVGIHSAAYRKDPEDPAWANDPGMREFFDFMDKHYPSGGKNDVAALGYASAQSLVHVLRQCGDDLTRENFMKQAASLRNVEIGLLLPGITMTTSPTDFVPIDQFQMMRFNGEHWVLFGPVISP
jgi:branched-chain amino acid transport system substrate-binding protein